MAINIPIRDPAANGAPLGPNVVAQVVSAFKGTMTVHFVLTDEADGTDGDPLAGVHVGGNVYTVPAGAFPIAGHFYTVVVVALAIDPATGSVLDTGSSARIKCRR